MSNTSTRSEDLKYLDAILNNNSVQLEEMYRELLPLIRSLVRANNGHDADAKDVLQDGLMVVYEKATQPNFQLTSSFKTYLFSICRFIWLRKLKKKDNLNITLEEDIGLTEGETIEKALIQEEKWGLFNKHFATLGKDCQKVLRLFFAGVKLKAIAKQMTYTDQFVKTKKFMCKKKLVEKIKGDQVFRELL